MVFSYLLSATTSKATPIQPYNGPTPLVTATAIDFLTKLHF